MFGVGSRSYGASFNAFARELSRRMRALGAAEILPVCEGDVDGGDLDEVFDLWSGRLLAVLEGKGGNSLGSKLENGGVSENESFGESEDDESDADEELGIVDLEDIAGKGPSRSSSGKASNSKSSKPLPSMNGEEKGKKEMVTPIIRANLEKQVSLSFCCFGYLNGSRHLRICTRIRGQSYSVFLPCKAQFLLFHIFRVLF